MRARVTALAFAMSITVSASIAACGDSGDSSEEPLPTEAGANPDGVAVLRDVATPDTTTVPSEFGLDTRPQNTTCKPPKRPPSTSAVKYCRRARETAEV